MEPAMFHHERLVEWKHAQSGAWSVYRTAADDVEAEEVARECREFFARSFGYEPETRITRREGIRGARAR